MKISRIDRHSPVAGVDLNGSSNRVISDYQFKEVFDFRQIDNRDHENNASDLSYEIKDLFQIFTKLIEEVVSSGCQLVVSKELAIDDYVIEAYFVSSSKKTKTAKIILPLPILETIIPAIDPIRVYRKNYIIDMINSKIIQPLCGRISERSLLKRIILLCHEFGHYTSFLRDSYNRELNQATQYLYRENHTQLDSRWISAILCEEITAWRIAEDKIQNYFANSIPELFFQIRDVGLASYSKKLNLDKADISVFTKLSLLGVDLAKL